MSKNMYIFSIFDSINGTMETNRQTIKLYHKLPH